MKILIGKIVAKKMNQTVTVVVERNVAHPGYKKRIRLHKKYLVQDDTNSEVGQIVKFVSTKPYSKKKRWKILDITKTAKLNKK